MCVLTGSTGYGHEDEGRLALDALFAELVGAPAALVRPQFFSGTHTIACALYGALRPGDELLALAGHPYDTLEEVIGLRGRPGDGSLAELGVTYRELPLAANGGLDWAAIQSGVLKPSTRCAHTALGFVNPPLTRLGLQRGPHPTLQGLRHASDVEHRGDREGHPGAQGPAA